MLSKSRKYFDDLTKFAIDEGKRPGYITFGDEGEVKGPIVKFLNESQLQNLKAAAKLTNGDAIFFICAKELEAAKIAGKIRTKLGVDLELIDYDRFEFCWITDFPFYEFNEDTKKIDF